MIRVIEYSSDCSCKGKDKEYLTKKMEYCRERARKAGQSMAAWEDAADQIEMYIRGGKRDD